MNDQELLCEEVCIRFGCELPIYRNCFCREHNEEFIKTEMVKRTCISKLEYIKLRDKYKRLKVKYLKLQKQLERR